MLLIHLKRMIQKPNASVLSSLHFPKSTNRSGALDILICIFRWCIKKERNKERIISRFVMCSIKLYRHDAKCRYEYCIYFCSCVSTKSSFTKKLEGGENSALNLPQRLTYEAPSLCLQTHLWFWAWRPQLSMVRNGVLGTEATWDAGTIMSPQF